MSTKWTEAQREKFAKTMKSKRAAKKTRRAAARANGGDTQTASVPHEETALVLRLSGGEMMSIPVRHVAEVRHALNSLK